MRDLDRTHAQKAGNSKTDILINITTTKRNRNIHDRCDFFVFAFLYAGFSV